jgi:TM2 domain-containing membrane protein YozV
MQNEILQLKGNEILMYDSMKKSKVVAYLLGALFGGLGIHRLYLKEYVGFWCYLTCTLASFIVSPLVVVLVFFLLVDVIYTWILCDQYNKDVIKKIVHSRTPEKSEREVVHVHHYNDSTVTQQEEK